MNFSGLPSSQSRLKIPMIFGFDVIHGYRTIFPVPLAEAATWDPVLVERAAGSGRGGIRSCGSAMDVTSPWSISRAIRGGVE